jgi:hypothetical protein
MVERFYQAGQSLFAVMAEGGLWVADLPKLAWQPILPDLPHINAISHQPGDLNRGYHY